MLNTKIHIPFGKMENKFVTDCSSKRTNGECLLDSKKLKIIVKLRMTVKYFIDIYICIIYIYLYTVYMNTKMKKTEYFF